MKAKARLVALFSRSGIAGTEACRAASPDSSSRAPGRGASSPRRLRLALACLVALGLAALAASPAAAEISVELNGDGAGTVTSEPAGIECSNVGGGAPGPSCSASPAFFEEVELTATPAAGSLFTPGWSGTDPAAEFLLNGPACVSAGTAPSCWVVDFEAQVTATFAALPDPPTLTAGGSGPGAGSTLRKLEGTLDPNEAEVESCRFEYGPTSKYGFSAPCSQSSGEIGEGNTPQPVSGEAELEHLIPGATHHFRLVASNLGGESKSADATFTTPPGSTDGCSNAGIRAGQVLGAILLPECMALEMVSPPKKGGKPAHSPAISADGERVLFRSNAGLAGTPGVLEFNGDFYVADRGGSGWTTDTYTVPPAPLIFGWSTKPQARSFSPDFSCWFQVASTQAQFDLGKARAYRGCDDGSFSALSPLLESRGSKAHSNLVSGIGMQGASADQSRFYFNPGNPGTSEGEGPNSITYSPEDPVPNGAGSQQNAYVAGPDANGQPSLELMARDRDGKVWGGSCGASLGGIGGAGIGARNQGAVSADGSRAYFSTRVGQPFSGECAEPFGNEHKVRILERRESNQGVWIGELFSSECDRVSPPCSTVDGGDLYQGASNDQSKVYFTTNRQLADSDLDSEGEFGGTGCALPPEFFPEAEFEMFFLGGCDLYLYDSARPAGQRLVQVSAGEELGAGVHEQGKGADVVNGTVAISTDGSHVYFAARGVLTDDPNPKGKEASEFPGAEKLYLWDAGTEETSFIGALHPGDRGSLWAGEGTFRNGAYPVPASDPGGAGGGGDGHILVFRSRAELTEEDADGTRRDVYRFDGDADTLECVSCRPGGPDAEPVDISQFLTGGALGTDALERQRWVSEDGRSVVLGTVEALVPGDINGAEDTYLWRDGELWRVPGTAGTASGRAALSHDGLTVAFQTAVPLLPQDGDGASDVYIAKAGGGYKNAAVEPPCEPITDCREPQPEPPAGIDNGSATPRSGNPPQPCGTAGKRAQKLSQRAKRLRRNAKRVSNARKARRMHGKARRLAASARNSSLNAKRCRQVNRGAQR